MEEKNTSRKIRRIFKHMSRTAVVIMLVVFLSTIPLNTFAETTAYAGVYKFSEVSDATEISEDDGGDMQLGEDANVETEEDTKEFNEDISEDTVDTEKITGEGKIIIEDTKESGPKSDERKLPSFGQEETTTSESDQTKSTQKDSRSESDQVKNNQKDSRSENDKTKNMQKNNQSQNEQSGINDSNKKGKGKAEKSHDKAAKTAIERDDARESNENDKNSSETETANAAEKSSSETETANAADKSSGNSTTENESKIIKSAGDKNNPANEMLDSYQKIQMVINPDLKKTGKLYWPLPLLYGRNRISSYYGMRHGTYSGMHSGMDIAAPTGTPIYACKEGVVILSEYSSSAGNWVVVDHGDGIYTEYMHMSVRQSAVGDKVVCGQQIGLVGSTGWSTGPHLHIGVVVSNNGYSVSGRVDPYPYLLEQIKERWEISPKFRHIFTVNGIDRAAEYAVS